MNSLPHFILLFYRASIAALMIPHGLKKWTKLMAGGEIKFYNFIGLGPGNTLTIAVVTELVAPICILLGWWTRWWSASVCITMLVAAFLVHAGDPFDERESSLCYFLMYFVLLWKGGGRWSLEEYLLRK
jgi:putative oxidoreductase